MFRHRLRSLVEPLQEFLRLEAAGGLALMSAAAIAMIVANTPAGHGWQALLATPLRIGIADFALQKPVLMWINDGLMALFFVLVGLELKREVVEGHLSTWRRAALPAFSAIGGVLFPALFYLAFNSDDAEAVRGWAIPTATDIAFALGVLSLLGKRIAPALKAFLLSVAIFDDLGAIVIIAVFYTADLSLAALAMAAVLVGTLVALNRLGVRRIAPYLLIGALLWLAVLKSGVHATLAGVVTALCIPLRDANGNSSPDTSPLLRTEGALHPWVAFGVLPIFALANAGVALSDFSWNDVTHPVVLGVSMGLLPGKPLGIMLLAWLSVRIGVAALPEDVDWRQLLGVALLCGIGFTMSLFIASLAFEAAGTMGTGLERVGILIGTLLSAICGYVLLRSRSGVRLN